MPKTCNPPPSEPTKPKEPRRPSAREETQPLADRMAEHIRRHDWTSVMRDMAEYTFALHRTQPTDDKLLKLWMQAVHCGIGGDLMTHGEKFPEGLLDKQFAFIIQDATQLAKVRAQAEDKARRRLV